MGGVDEHAKIAAKRKFAEERRQRILDPRNAVSGVDYAALGKQIQERADATAASKAEEKKMAATLVDFDRLTLIQERNQAAARRERAKAVADYRQANQTAETRDTYDLNRPDRLKFAKPLRAGDDDTLGASSMQKFAGEDPEFAARKQLQQQQVRQWSQEAADALAAAAAMSSEESKAAHAQMMHQIAAVESQQSARVSARAGLTASVKMSNIEQAAAKRDAERKAQKQKLEEDEKDILAQVSGPLLSEDPALAYGRDGKILTDRFKGFSEEQLQEIYTAQKQQALEEKARRSTENAELRDHVKKQSADAQAMLLQERAMMRKRRSLNSETAEANLRAAEERRASGAGGPTKNTIDESFFTQFGTSHR